MGSLILLDNDALLKLARYGLLDEAIAVFNCTFTDVRVLETAKYALIPTRNRLLHCQEEESARRLEIFFQVSQPLNLASVDADLLDALIAIPNIDAGEALLLAAGVAEEGALVVTGDKRSLAALCSYSSVASVARALAGRIVSMEVLFSCLIEHQFPRVRECVRSKPDVDKALAIAFGVSIPHTFELVQEGLTSYIRDLRAKTGDLLYQPFR